MKSKTIPFTVEHVDSLGQGVSKRGKKVLFLPQTLPGESGIAEVVNESKNVLFGKVIQREVDSEKRVPSPCPHYSECGGCHYLHTDYENELEMKLESFKHAIKKLYKGKDVGITASPNRLAYRNRLQLHYDQYSGELGFYKNKNTEIVQVPKCVIGNEQLQGELKRLYKDYLWLDMVEEQGEQDKGHIEIYQKPDGDMSLTFNQPYSAGGFSQVNAGMNQVFLDFLSSKEMEGKVVLDLFGGNGNMTAHLTDRDVHVVDNDERKQEDFPEHQTYHQINLYSRKAIKDLKEKLPEKIDVLIVDPPRSGLKNLMDFSRIFRPEHIIYISCFYPSQIRDISPIRKFYNLEEVQLFDFFPGTHHVESFIHLKKKEFKKKKPQNNEKAQNENSQSEDSTKENVEEAPSE